MFMCNICDGLNINQICVGISDRLDKNKLRVILNSFFKNFNAFGRINKSCINSKIFYRVFKKIKSSAVNSSSRNNMMTVMSQSLCNISYSRRTRSNCQSRRTVFKGGNSFFKNILRGISQTSVNISCRFQSKSVCRILRIMEYIRSSLINRNRAGISCRVGRFLSDM